PPARPPLRPAPPPYPTLFRPVGAHARDRPPRVRLDVDGDREPVPPGGREHRGQAPVLRRAAAPPGDDHLVDPGGLHLRHLGGDEDRKSTRLNSSHQIISYAVL